MSSDASKTERLHSLDSLRAIMMMLGLVIHSAITYGVEDYGGSWSIKDPISTHLFNDYLVSLIHSFRMQIFFLVAGFFGAMLFYERSPLRMAKNRFSRILLPFLVFVFLLWPSIRFGFSYTYLVFEGASDPFSGALAKFSGFESFLPKTTFHLWFLYYLAYITLFSIGLGLIFRKMPGLSKAISTAFDWTIKKPFFRLLVFSSITALVYLGMNSWRVSTSISFKPHIQTFSYYLSFYLIGWLLFKSKQHLDSIKKYDLLFTLLGVVLFSFYFFENESFSFYTKVAIKSVLVWLFIFGITGLFIRFASDHSYRMRYISDSSYWVYLLHLSLTAIFPSFIVNWPIPSTLKFLTVLLSTTVICFITYHYLVRSTFIGEFLNGRRYQRKGKSE